GAGRATGRGGRAAGGGDPAEPGAAERPPDVLREGGPEDRGRAVRSRRLPVPAQVGRLPPRRRRPPRPAARRRVQRGAAAHALDGDRAAPDRDATATGVGTGDVTDVTGRSTLV